MGEEDAAGPQSRSDQPLARRQPRPFRIRPPSPPAERLGLLRRATSREAPIEPAPYKSAKAAAGRRLGQRAGARGQDSAITGMGGGGLRRLGCPRCRWWRALLWAASSLSMAASLHYCRRRPGLLMLLRSGNVNSVPAPDDGPDLSRADGTVDTLARSRSRCSTRANPQPRRPIRPTLALHPSQSVELEHSTHGAAAM